MKFYTIGYNFSIATNLNLMNYTKLNKIFKRNCYKSYLKLTKQNNLIKVMKNSKV